MTLLKSNVACQASVAAFVALTVLSSGVALAKTDKKDKKLPPIKLKYGHYELVRSDELVKSPEQYLKRGIVLEGTFNSFSNLGLDYKKAFRDSKDYVSLLILRADVPHRKIPLSELKLIFPRKRSETLSHLDAGDAVRISGSLFSTALDDPWMDVEKIEIVKKAEQKKKKAKDKVKH